jgi:hypothetical protein
MQQRKKGPLSAEARAESKFSSYMAGSLRTRESKIPGTEHAFVWRRLSSNQGQDAVDAAVKRFNERDLPLELRSYQDLEDEITIQVLHLAMRDPSVPGTDRDPFPKRLADSAKELGDFLDEDLRDILANEYKDFVDDNSAAHDVEPSGDEMAELERAIEKKDVRLLNSFEPRTLRHYLLTLASRPLH